jgi:pimeloyl-ACP methyl ester carboxylesterase
MISVPWYEKVGTQRTWFWRGWHIRYSYARPLGPPTSDSALGVDRVSSTPMILLHGFGASLGHWRHNLDVFGESRSVYALDLLGFGASEKAPVLYNVELWVDQVYHFWRTFIGQPVILVGNSIGSLIALAAAAAHPEMVKGLIMISIPDPGLRTEMMPPTLQPIVGAIEGFFMSPLLLRPLFSILRRRGIIRAWLRLAYGNAETVTEDLVEMITQPTTDRGSARAFCLLCQGSSDPKFGQSVKKLLGTVDVNLPILLLWGKEDGMIPPRLARPQDLLPYHPRLELILLEGVGHCPQDECPEKVNPIILDWVEKMLGDK